MFDEDSGNKCRQKDGVLENRSTSSQLMIQGKASCIARIRIQAQELDALAHNSFEFFPRLDLLHAWSALVHHSSQSIAVRIKVGYRLWSDLTCWNAVAVGVASLPPYATLPCQQERLDYAQDCQDPSCRRTMRRCGSLMMRPAAICGGLAQPA